MTTEPPANALAKAQWEAFASFAMRKTKAVTS